MKTLYLIRHAKSSWENKNIKDFDRPLNNRGINDAPIMGHRLFSNKIIPDLILSSNAKRAIHTAQLIAAEINYPPKKIVKKNQLYNTSIVQLIQLIEELPSAMNCVFIIGHNPTISSLVKELTAENYGSLPTNGIVGIEFSINQWLAIGKGNGSIIYYDYPKNN